MELLNYRSRVDNRETIFLKTTFFFILVQKGPFPQNEKVIIKNISNILKQTFKFIL